MKKPLTSDYIFADYWVHPVPLAAVTVTFINDQWLKYYFPGWFTGKLSDFCGLFYFPMLLCAMCTILQLGFKKSVPSLSKRLVMGCLIVTGLIFLLVKTSPDVQRIYVEVFSWTGVKAQVTTDMTDLLALGILPFTYFYLKPYTTDL